MPASSAVFEVLADPTRLRIVESLREGERSVGSLVSALAVSQPGVSRHLRILAEAGFVRARAEGQRRFYSLRREPFQDLDAWVHDFQSLAEGRLDRLGRLVESDERPSRRPRPHEPRSY